MKTMLCAGVAATALLLGSAAPSHATLMISLDDHAGDTATVTDNGAGDLNPTLGADTFAGALGNFIVNVTTGLSKPVIGSALFPQMDLNSVDVTSTAGGTLTLQVTDTDFIGNAVGAAFVSAIGGTQGGGGSLTDSTFLDCSNAAFGTGTSLATQSFSGGGAFSGGQLTNVSPVCGGGLYSLTEMITLSLPSAGNTSFDASLAVPEPSTIALFGAGLVGLGFAMRRKGRAMTMAA